MLFRDPKHVPYFLSGHLPPLPYRVAGELIEMSCYHTLQTQLEFHTNARVMIITCPSHTTLLLILASLSGICFLLTTLCLANSYAAKPHSLQETLSSFLSPLILSLAEYVEL